MSKRPSERNFYKGILRTPLRSPWISSLEDDRAKRKAEIRGKFRCLVDHYGIDPKSKNPWLTLALALARQHVPGLKEEKRGARGWSPEKRTNLYRAVLTKQADAKNAGKKCSIENACKMLARESEWRSAWRTLKRRFDQERSRRRKLDESIQANDRQLFQWASTYPDGTMVSFREYYEEGQESPVPWHLNFMGPDNIVAKPLDTFFTTSKENSKSPTKETTTNPRKPGK
jgi:hypothetical protein